MTGPAIVHAPPLVVNRPCRLRADDTLARSLTRHGFDLRAGLRFTLTPIAPTPRLDALRERVGKPLASPP